MYINKKGKNQADEEASQVDKSSLYSEPNNAGNSIRIGGTQPLGRSPTNGTRKQQDLDKSTLENGPEIMYIDVDQNDRRNPMMDYTDGRQTANNFGKGRSSGDSSNADFGHNYRNSVLTNVRNDVGTNRDGGRIANKTIPLNFDPEREKSPKVINLDESTYSANTRTLNQKRLNNPNKGFSNTGNITPNQNTHKSNNTTANNNNYNQNVLHTNQSSNLTTKSDANQTYISDTNKQQQQRRNLNQSSANPNTGGNGIIKKMSPNRNNDMNMDLNAQRDVNKMAALKKLSIFSEKNNPNLRGSIKPEFSVDTRDHLHSRYTNDLDKIMKINKKQENFKKYNSNALVANNPKEGRLYTTQTHTISPIQKELEEHKQAIKNMTKLSTILLKDKMPSTNNPNAISGSSSNRNIGVRSTSNDFQEKTLRRNLANSSSPSGKFIRVTMALLSSKGPNCEDRIITRQMRFEKGGVVDLAQPGLKNNRSAPKKPMEVKKTNLRSPRPLRNSAPRFTQKEENAAKLVQAWWRDILAKYKDVVNKIITIQKSWRRYFVRKNLYYKLSAFYFYAYIFDKIENLIRRHNIELGYSALYNQNAEKYNAIKYLRSVIFLQRAFKFYRNLKKQKELASQGQNPKVSTAKTTLRKAVKIPKGKAYDNQNSQGSDHQNDTYTGPNDNNRPRTNNRYGDDDGDQEQNSQPKNLLRNGKGANTNANPAGAGGDKRGNQNDTNPDDDFNLVSSPKEKALTEQLKNLRNKFLTNSLSNAFKKNSGRNLTQYVLRWIKNAALGSNKTDAGRKLAATDIAKAIIKKKYDLFIANLRKAGEKPTRTLALNRIAHNLLGFFNNRKRLAFNNLKKNVPGIKNKINDEFIYKILGMHCKKTSAKIVNRKLADRLRLWRNKVAQKLKEELEAKSAPLKNQLKKQNNAPGDQDEPSTLVSAAAPTREKTLKSLLTHLQAKFRNLNLPQFFNAWRNLGNEKKISNLRNKVLQRTINSLDTRRKVRSIAKRFALWRARAQENRTVDEQVLISAANNQKLTAASKLAPALKDLMRGLAAKAAKDAILALVQAKNRKAALSKLLKYKPLMQKYSLQKYFDKFKNNVTEKEKEGMKTLLLKTYCRRLLEKSTSELLRKKLNTWWRSLPHTANTERLRGLQAVDKLKQALQKRYFAHPKEALKEKIENGNVDWALMFMVEFKKKFVKSSIREYVIRWRNNYLGDLVNDKMKNFYSKLLMGNCKRYCSRILAKKFKKWRDQKDKLKNEDIVCSASNINSTVKGLYRNRLKAYFDHLLGCLGKKKKITKFQVASGILVDMYFNRDTRLLGKKFRLWNKKAIAGEVGELKANLISRILTGLLNKHDGLKNVGKLNVYFNKWKDTTERDVEKLSNLGKLINRYLLSSRFHDKHVRGNIEDLLEIASHINHLRKKQALKIGDFMGAVLAIYKRINIMKRQKALIEALHKMNFYEKMQIMTASKRWLNKTAIVGSHDKATILQDFIRKIYQHKNEKAVQAQKAAVSLDNFTKRFVFFKMSDAARLNKLISVLMKLFGYIPKELRKNYLRKTCSEWRQTAQIEKKNSASGMILKYLKGYIARKFIYKLKLKKHFLTEIVRRGLKKFVNEKFYYMTEWARIAKLLGLKYNALILGSWIPDKFQAFKKLKAFRVLSDLLKKKEFNYIVGTMKTLGKTSKLVDAVNAVSYKKNAAPLLKGIKKKYFRKKYASVFADLGYQLRFCSVAYYADKWRNRVMDLQNLALVKIQAWVRMALQRLKAKRQLRRNRLVLKYILQVHWDAKLAKQGYVNLWRDTIKYADLDNKVNTLIKFIKTHNEKMDYEKEIANQHLRKIFDKYLLTNIKYALVDCRNYKDSVVDVLKNLDSKIEKRYALNNLIDFGKDTLRNAFVEMVTGKQDTLTKNNLIRQAVEKWRLYNARLLHFVLKLQRMRRGKVFRDFFEKSKKIYDLFALLTVKYLGDKPLKKVRVSQWRNRALFFTNKEKANVIQKFLRDHLTGVLRKRLQDLFEKGFRNHFVSCVGQVSKFKKLKNSLTKPLNVVSMQAIRRRFVILKIRDMLTDLMGNATEENKKMHKEDVIKRWRMQTYKINEQEKFAALMIVASIKAKLMKLRIKRWQDLSLRAKYLIYKAFGDEGGVKRCFVLQWLNNAKRTALSDSRLALVGHAKGILDKIKKSDHNNKTNKIGDGIESVIDTIKKHLGKTILNKILHKNRDSGLNRMDEIYGDTYKKNTAEAIKKINLYGFYRLNLIKKIQKYWKTKYKLWRFIMRVRMMRKAMQYAANKELALKHAYTIAWRNIIKKAADKKHASRLHQFYRDILNRQLKKKSESENVVQKLAKKLNLRNSILDVFRKLKTLMHLKNINNIIVRSHFDYFKFKSLILYILYILHGQFNKVEAKVKSTCVYKYRKIALKLRDREAANSVTRVIREVNRRRHDNKIRDILVRIANGRECDENEIKMRTAAHWCRNAFMLKTQEKVKVIEDFMQKKKRASDLNKKWQRFGLRLQGKNGIVTAELLLERIRMFRKTEPLVRFVKRHNIGENGKDLLDGIKRKLILLFVRKALGEVCDIGDSEKLKEHAKYWRLKCWKLQNREKAFENASNTIQNKFYERGFRAIVGAYDFKRFSGLAQLAQKFDAIRRMRAKAKAMENVRKFADGLVSAQEFHIDSGSETFRDKVYKFYVYKLLANMGAIFLKLRDREHKPVLFKKFVENLVERSSDKSATKYADKLKVQRAPKTLKTQANHQQLSAEEKKEIELLGKEGKDHTAKCLGLFVPMFKKIADKRKTELADKMLTMSLLGKLKRIVQKQKKNMFEKLADTVKDSLLRANMYAMLRKIYLNKKLKEIESANKYLMMNHLVKLATVTKAKVDSRLMLKTYRIWKFYSESEKIKQAKLDFLKEKIDKFSTEIKDNLFHGKNNILSQFNQFNKSAGIYENPKVGTMKTLGDKASNDFKNQKTVMNKPNLDKATTLVQAAQNPKLNKKETSIIDPNKSAETEEDDKNSRDTIAFGREAKKKFDSSNIKTPENSKSSRK